MYRTTKLPQVGCPYLAANQCSNNSAVPACCERIGGVEDRGVVLRATVGLFMTLPLLAAIIG